MNVEEALIALKEGKKLTHPLLKSHQWVMQSTIPKMVVTEDGEKTMDSIFDKGFDTRWAKNWDVFEEPESSEEEIYILTKAELIARDNLQKALCLAAAENSNHIDALLVAITKANSPELPVPVKMLEDFEIKEASFAAVDKKAGQANLIDAFSWRLGAKFAVEYFFKSKV